MKKKLIFIIPAAVIAALLIAFFIFAGTYYRADPSASEALVSDEAVAVTKTDYGWYFDGPSDSDALVFYPGARVDEAAYAPLLHSLAANGIDVCLVKMPFHLALFGMNKAGEALDGLSYENCYIGGHSLGGAIAANYAAEHGDSLAGVILLAAYPTKQLDNDLLLISVSASEDGVISRDKLEDGRNYAPERYVEYVIEGGNHAQFGDYGEQSGDGTALISREEQQRQTVDVIIKNICR